MLANAEIDTGDLFDSGGAQLSDQFAEMQLLGLIMIRPSSFGDIAGSLACDDLFDPWHRRIFGAMKSAWDAGENLSIEVLINGLGGDPKSQLWNGVTVAGYLAQLVAEADVTNDLDDLAEHIAECSERRAVGAADDVYVPFASKFGGMRWSEIGAAGSPQYEWIIENLIPKGETVLLFGDSGTGKSFSAFDMSIHIALGKTFYGRNVEPGLVIYVAAEGGKGFAKRKTAYATFHDLGDAELPFYLLTRRPDFFTSDIDVDLLIGEITGICRLYQAPLVLIVLDTLSALTPGMNENASADVSRVRQRMQKLVDAFGVSTAFVHHVAKGGTTPRGHGSLTGDFEINIHFTTTDMKSMDGLPVHQACASKEREGKKGETWQFTLPVIPVGRNKWGNEETSCVAVPYDGKSRAFAYGFKANPTEMTFMNSLFEALVDHGVAPPSGLPVVITKAVDLGEVRAVMKSRYITGEEDVTKADNRFRSAFKRAGDSLKAGGVIGYRAPLVWYSGKPVHGLTSQAPDKTND